MSIGYLNGFYKKSLPLTSVYLYACSAVHSAFDVGLLSANITGHSLNDAIDLINFSVKAPGMAAAPGKDDVSINDIITYGYNMG